MARAPFFTQRQIVGYASRAPHRLRASQGSDATSLSGNNFSNERAVGAGTLMGIFASSSNCVVISAHRAAAVAHRTNAATGSIVSHPCYSAGTDTTIEVRPRPPPAALRRNASSLLAIARWEVYHLDFISKFFVSAKLLHDWRGGLHIYLRLRDFAHTGQFRGLGI